MARGFRGRAGASKPPQRQIGNSVLRGDATLTFGASASATAIGSFGARQTGAAATLVRTRGAMQALVTNSGISDNVIEVVLGIIVVSLEAFNAGIASIPTPLSDPERAWIVWQPLAVTAISANPDQGAFGTFAQVAVDSRGMRKVKFDDIFVAVFEGFQLSATTGTVVLCSYTLRMQQKL